MADDYKDEFKQGIKNLEATLQETNAKIEKKAGRNLFFAIGTGLIFAAIFIGSLFWAKPVFALLVAALVVLASLELTNAYRGSGRRVPRVGIVISSLLVLAGAFWFGAQGALSGMLAGLFLLMIWRLIEGLVPRWEVPAKTLTRDVFSGLFTLLYIAFLGSFAILLVKIQRGEFWVFTMVAVVVLIDIGAFAAGVLFGKHKMTPRISPNKTWEGFAGGAVAGTTMAIFCAIFLLKQPWWIGVVLGLLMLITATMGDLVESLIKRNLGIKDMSGWIPGHGGFLDRLDSLLPSTVPVYVVAIIVGVV